MTLATKIGAGFLLLVLVTAVLSGSQLTLISRLHAESRELSQVSFEAARLSLQLQSHLGRLRELSHKSLILGDPAYGAEADRVRAEIESGLARLKTFELTVGERHELTALEALWHATDTLDAAQDGQELTVATRRTRLDDDVDALNAQLDRLAAASRQAMAARVETSGKRVEQARRTAGWATFAGLLAATAITLLVVRSLVRPLRRLGRGTRALSEGDFEHRVPAEGGPELAALAEDFNHMAHQLSQLDQLKKDFLANVSHDLKTPLASMQEATKLLLEGIPGPLEDRQRRLLRLNLKSGDRLFRMIDDLLHLSKLAAGTVEYSPRHQDLVELARAAIDEIGTLADDADLELEADLPDQPIVLTCDGPAIHKMLQNLLGNAVKYTPAGGRAGLRLRPLNAHSELPATIPEPWSKEAELPAAIIEVWDTGPGIPDDHKRRIFERFHRVSTGGPPGTGLGLAIAHEIVTVHGGRLWVDDRPGQGSIFRVLLGAQPPTGSSAGEIFSASAGSGDGDRRKATSWAALALVAALGMTSLAGCSRPPEPVVQPSPLEIADAAFDRGDFAAANDAYQEHLHFGTTAAVDRVLFRLALMSALPASAIRDPRRARQLFGELVERFPDSPYRSAAEYLMKLESEVFLLRRQLDEIKRIDLGHDP